MPLPGAFTSQHRAQKVFITSIILIVKRGSIQLFTYKCSAGSSKLSEIMDLEHGKRRDKIMDRDSEWIHNAEKKGVYFVWGPVAHTYLYKCLSGESMVRSNYRKFYLEVLESTLRSTRFC